METILSIHLLTFLGTLYTAQASPVGLSELTQLLEQENFPLSAKVHDVRRKRSVLSNDLLGFLGLKSLLSHQDNVDLNSNKGKPNKLAQDSRSINVLSFKILQHLADNSQQASEEKPILFALQSRDLETKIDLNKLTTKERQDLLNAIMVEHIQHQQDQEPLNNSAVKLQVGETK